MLRPMLAAGIALIAFIVALRVSRTLRKLTFYFVKLTGDYIIDRNPERVLLTLAIGAWIVVICLAGSLLAITGFLIVFTIGWRGF